MKFFTTYSSFILVLFFNSIVFCNEYSLVHLKTLIPSLVTDLKYATNDNFTGKQVYPSCAQAYLVKDAAHSLKKIQEELARYGLGIKIWDAYRPFSVTQIFWDVTPEEKRQYVADPKKGSVHNRGNALDCTLVDLKTGKELEMPSNFDEFSEYAHCDYRGACSQALINRAFFHMIMYKHGWKPIKNEWWHFNYKDYKSYPVLDLPFEELIIN